MRRIETGRRRTSRGAGRRTAAGFTLLETVIALLVMMIVGLGATSLFFYAIRYNAGAAERAMAIAVAQQKMEELRAVGWDDPLLAATAGTDICTTAAPCYSASRPYVATKVITDSNDVTVNGVTRSTMKTITVSVTPLQSGIPWAAGAVNVTTHRTILLHGPYAN